MPSPFEAKTLYDSLFSFEAGMNGGKAPLLLAKNEMAMAISATVRGDFVTHRPSFRKIPLSFTGDANLDGRFEGGKYQGGGYFRPDNGDGTLCAAVSGRLFQITLAGATANVTEHVSLASGGGADADYPNPEAQRQAWLWQSEKWLVYQDGVSNPLFFDGTTTVRSNYGVAESFSTDLTAGFTVPAIGSTAAAVGFDNITKLSVGDIVTVQYRGQYQVLSITPGVAPAGAVELLNLNGTPPGFVVAAAEVVSWTHIGKQLPPGRMGTYGMGRNWMALVDGKQFLAGDLVGGSSGTVAHNYRDAVLNITENLYLAGGGNFTVPGNPGDIKAMRFVATLDASLGQGPLQVVTRTGVFSCQAPVDRLTWQDMTTPILTESLVGRGGVSQNGTVVVSGDLMFRSLDGIQSLILGRRDFNTWGNVPCSAEVDGIFRQDSQSLLEFATAAVFDNRLLMSSAPVLDAQGVYWLGLVALNFDPTSSLRGKAPSVYDGLWTGLNVFQLIVGEFAGVERCLAFTLNAATHKIELWELLKDEAAYYDNGSRRIVWEFESPVLDFNQKDPKRRELLQLYDGELHVDNLLGAVEFFVFYRPDQWPCWVPWHSWSECAQAPDPARAETSGYQPQFRPAMGLGEPSPVPCDQTNNRPLRLGYSFQIKVVVVGHCRVLGARFAAHTVPEAAFAKKVCDPICLDTDTASDSSVAQQQQNNVALVAALEAVTQNDGTVVPIITGNQQPAGTNYGRLYNLSDGKWYDLIGFTMNDGTVVPLCDQTPHNTPTGA